MLEETDYKPFQDMRNPDRPKQKLADIRKTMAEKEKEKEHVIWVNQQVIVTDSDTTEDEEELSKRYVWKFYIYIFTFQ